MRKRECGEAIRRLKERLEDVVLVGVDFDNTIVCYDEVFHQVAVERGLISPDAPATKGYIRGILRQEDREDLWTELQGYVYGARMLDARPFPGVVPFFNRCRCVGIDCCIISHRTRHPFLGPQYDLHQVAQQWIKDMGLLQDASLSSSCVHFELTPQAKLSRIVKQQCDVFIDDLPEFLLHPEFPAGIERILFDPSGFHLAEPCFRRTGSWEQITDWVVSMAKSGEHGITQKSS